MTTQYTTLLGLALPVQGELTGTWGNEVNDAITTLLDSAIAGATVISSDADITLDDTDGAANEARQAIIVWSAGGTITRNVTAPARSKVYVVINTEAVQDIVLRGLGPTTGIPVLAGEKCIAAWDGSDFVKIATTNNTIPFMGTGINSYTQGDMLFYDSGDSLSSLPIEPSGYVMTSDGTGPQWQEYLDVAQGGTGNNTLSGILKGAGTSPVDTAVAGTDYVAPNTVTNFTAQQNFNGATSAVAASFVSAAEKITVSATVATGTINYDVTTQSILYYTSNASANWTVNFRASSGTTLNSALSIGQATTVVFMVTNGATPYYNNVVQVDGVTVTPKYQGGIAWSYGTASGIDAYTYTIIKTGNAAFTVLASQIRFA